MLMHHALAVGHGLGIPVHFLAALPIHGIEADVLGLGNCRVEPRSHGMCLPGAGLFNGFRPFRRKRGHILSRQRSIGLGRGLIKSQLHHGQVGVTQLQIIMQLQLRQCQFHPVQLFHALPQMHQHQVALVPQHGVNDGGIALLRRRGHLHQPLRCGAADTLPIGFVQRAPCLPVHAIHLMQHARAFQCQRYRRILRHSHFLSACNSGNRFASSGLVQVSRGRQRTFILSVLCPNRFLPVWCISLSLPSR